MTRLASLTGVDISEVVWGFVEAIFCSMFSVKTGASGVLSAATGAAHNATQAKASENLLILAMLLSST